MPILGRRRPTARRAASRCRSAASGTRVTRPACARGDRPRASPTVLTASGSFASSIRAAQLGKLVAFAFAELLLDRLQLLAQVVLTLRVGHLLLRLRFDLALQLEQRHFARQRVGDRLQLLQEVVLLEQRLLVRRLHVDERGQHVGEAQRVLDVHDDAAQFLGRARSPATAPSRSAPGCGGRAPRPRSCARTFSGSGVICARIDVPVRVYDVGADAREAFDDDVDAAAGPWPSAG